MSAEESGPGRGPKPRSAVSSFSGTIERRPPRGRQTAESSFSGNLLRRPINPSPVESFSGDRERPRFPGHDSRPMAMSGEFGQQMTEDSSVDPALEVGEQDRYVDPVLLGEGGMGRVMRVHDQRLRRDVAMKIVRAPTIAAEVRLAREARLTAQLDHPGIVAVFDAGRTEDGKLFYAMRLVRGRSLATVLAERSADTAVGPLLRHFLDVCSTIAYAHSMGVLHRDLKPANVLVGEFGETQVADWGLARKTDEPEPRGPARPVAADANHFDGNVFGTPAYMSPEQAQGQPLDERSDVWALGAILFEILTGEMPWGLGESLEVMARARTESVPPVRSVRPDAPVELAAIADRALQPDPADRYGSARELATDLERWFDGQTIDAYDYSRWELVLRVLRAWRAPLLVAAGALLLLIGGGLAAWRSTVAERDRALEAEAVARAAKVTADQAAATALVARAHSALRDDDRAGAEILAAAALRHAELPEARGVLASYAATERPARLEHLAWGPCRAVAVGRGGGAACAGDEFSQHRRADGSVTKVPGWARTALPAGDAVVVVGKDFQVARFVDGKAAPSREGRRSWGGASVDEDGRWLLQWGAHSMDWIATTGDAVRLLPQCPDEVPVESAELGPGARVAAVCSDGRLLLQVDGRSQKIPEALPLRYGVGASLSWSADGGRVALAGLRGGIAIYAADGTRVADLPSTLPAVRDVALDPTGARIAVLGSGGAVAVHDTTSGQRLARLPAGPFSALTWTGEAELLRAGDSVERWRLPLTPTLASISSDSGIADFDVSPDGTTVATAHGDGTLRLRDLATGALVAELQWQPRVLKDVAFSPDGQRVVAVGLFRGDIRVLDRDLKTVDKVEGQRSRRLIWLRDEIVAAPYAGGPLRWAWPDGEAELVGDTNIYDLEAEADRERALLYTPRAGFQLLRSGQPGLTTLSEIEDARGGVLLGDDILAIGGAWVARLGGGGERWRTELDTTPLDVAVSPDGRWAAVGLLDGSTAVLDPDTGELRALLRGHEERVGSVHLDGAGRLMTGGWDGRIRVASLERLDADADALLAELEAAWGIDSDAVLAGR